MERNKFEEIPPLVFSWLESTSFSGLSELQKKEVLRHFSQEEYEEMHHAAVALKQASLSNGAGVRPGRKQQLLDQFDAYHGRAKVVPLFPKQLLIWQVASVVLFTLCGYLAYGLVDLKADHRNQQTASLDTVFVTKEIKGEPSVIHDTVYLYKAEQKKQGRAGASHTPSRHDASPSAAAVAEDIYVLPVGETKPEPRGNSMRDDSLLRRFSFVSM